MRARIKNNSGYSLLEIMLVVALISILAGIIIPRFTYKQVTCSKVYTVAHNIAGDLRYARRLSIGQGTSGGSGMEYWLKLSTVGTATDTYRILEGGDEANPLKTYTVNGSDITIIGSSTDSYYFNTRGDPSPDGGFIIVRDTDNICQWNVSVIRSTGRIQMIQIK